MGVTANGVFCPLTWKPWYNSRSTFSIFQKHFAVNIMKQNASIEFESLRGSWDLWSVIISFRRRFSWIIGRLPTRSRSEETIETLFTHSIVELCQYLQNNRLSRILCGKRPGAPLEEREMHYQFEGKNQLTPHLV